MGNNQNTMKLLIINFKINSYFILEERERKGEKEKGRKRNGERRFTFCYL